MQGVFLTFLFQISCFSWKNFWNFKAVNSILL